MVSAPPSTLSCAGSAARMASRWTPACRTSEEMSREIETTASRCWFAGCCRAPARRERGSMAYGVRLHVWGEYACFTRPEFKAERVSYDVITPSAARGIFEAVHWKPAIRWVIDRIHVLRPIRFETVCRNEVGHKMAVSKVSGAMRRRTTAGLPLLVEDDRLQRATTRRRSAVPRRAARILPGGARGLARAVRARRRHAERSGLQAPARARAATRGRTGALSEPR